MILRIDWRLSLLGVFGGAVLSALPVWAEPVRPGVSVELFTSQSCSSCPPADAFLSELARRDDVVALEWHVDYWDDLVHGRAGSWEDPFSDYKFTKRQRAYNRRLRGTGSAYTPQMVIGGRREAAGFRMRDVLAALGAAAPSDAIALDIERAPGGAVTLSLTGTPPEGTDILYVRFLPKAETEVKRGENHGKRLSNTHVVVSAMRVGFWKGGPWRMDLHELNAAERCVVLVQGAGQGPVYYAAYCPVS